MGYRSPTVSVLLGAAMLCGVWMLCTESLVFRSPLGEPGTWVQFLKLVNASCPATARASPARPLPGAWFCLAAVAAVIVALGAGVRRCEGWTRYAPLLVVGWTWCVSATLLGLTMDPVVRAGPGIVPWLVGGGLAFGAHWVRRYEWSSAYRAWQRGRSDQMAAPPVVVELSSGLGTVVRQARQIRLALDPLEGVDADTADLLYEWAGTVRACPVVDQHVLDELGLDVHRAMVIASDEKRERAAVVFRLDLELARFEHALARYRRHGFR